MVVDRYHELGMSGGLNDYVTRDGVGWTSFFADFVRGLSGEGDDGSDLGDSDDGSDSTCADSATSTWPEAAQPLVSSGG